VDWMGVDTFFFRHPERPYGEYGTIRMLYLSIELLKLGFCEGSL